MTYMINYRGDAWFMILNDSQVTLLDWLNDNELLPSDFEYIQAEKVETFDLVNPE